MKGNVLWLAFVRSLPEAFSESCNELLPLLAVPSIFGARCHNSSLVALDEVVYGRERCHLLTGETVKKGSSRNRVGFSI